MARLIIGTSRKAEDRMVTYKTVEYVCDVCGEKITVEVREGDMWNVRPDDWSEVTIQGKDMVFCPVHTESRKKLAKSPEYERLYDLADEILELFEPYASDYMDSDYHGIPSQYEDLVALIDKIRELTDNYEEGV